MQQGGGLPIGLGLEDSNTAIDKVTNGVIWIEPLDTVPLDRNGKPVIGSAVAGTGSFQFPSSFAHLDDNEISRQKAELDRVAKNQQAIEEAIPVYTLPENSTLIGSRGMTALLGRVPIDGKVTDPYPFKVLIGKENLTANGIELPDVEGAIVSGTATGDWVLSCVRGEVQSITFVFTDGTVRTVPPPAKSSDGNNGKSNSGSIGWLSDENGIPCLSGERKSNASTYLPTLFALSGAGAAADAMANGQNTTSVDGTTVTSTLTGSAGQAALGKALSSGTNELADWVKARYGQMFDAVYVPPVPKWPSILPARSRLILRRRAARFTTILILASSMTFYLKAPTVKVLNTRQRDLTAVLLNAGLQPVKPEFDVAPLNGYLRALPMCFNPMHDKKHWYTRLTFVQHMANLLPVFGRDTGTGHPRFTFFNRGGAPLTFDPLNRIVPRMPTGAVWSHWFG